MSRYNRTKDENYVLSLFDLAVAAGDPESRVDRYAAGDRAKLATRAVDTICKLLIQANFIKKAGECEVFLTPHGLKLVNELRTP